MKAWENRSDLRFILVVVASEVESHRVVPEEAVPELLKQLGMLLLQLATPSLCGLVLGDDLRRQFAGRIGWVQIVIGHLNLHYIIFFQVMGLPLIHVRDISVDILAEAALVSKSDGRFRV